MNTYTASAGWASSGLIEYAAEEGAPPVVWDLAVLLADILVEHPDVTSLVVRVEVVR